VIFDLIKIKIKSGNVAKLFIIEKKIFDIYTPTRTHLKLLWLFYLYLILDKKNHKKQLRLSGLKIIQ